MKIGILKESLCIGGTERSAANISRALAKDHEVFTILYDVNDIKYPFGGTVVDLCCPARKSYFGKIVNTFVRNKRYLKAVKKNRLVLLFEFISIESPLSHIKRSKQIRIMSMRDFGKLSQKTALVRRCLSCSDAMVCNSEYIKSYYLSAYQDDREKVFTVYNIIDAQCINDQGKEEVEATFDAFRASHPRTVVAVGRFCKEKGFEYLLQSIAHARETDTEIGLVLVGNGNYLDGYRNIVNDLNLTDHVYFTGFQQNPYKYMSKCSCFVLSSLTEGFPNVLAEAMALGLPVIATSCLSGPAEILRDDMNYDAVTDRFAFCDYGVLTPRMTDGSNDNAVKELSKAICTLFSDSELLERYSNLSRKRAALYSEDAAREKLNEIFEILKARRSAR